MKTMKAIVYVESQHYEIQDVPVPEISRADEALVKVEAASICGTDVHIVNEPNGAGMATPGMTIGHEAVGKVVEIGENVGNVKVGDRVVLDPVISCGECYFCRHGEPNVCADIKINGCMSANGFFSEFALAPAKQLIKVSPDLKPELAVFSEPFNCVMGGMDKIRLIPGETALVLGTGPIGLYYLQLLKANGASTLLASEVSAFRTDYAYQCGAQKVINPKEENLVEAVMEATDGIGVDVVVDAVGVLVDDALKCARKGGRVLLFGQNWSATETICQNDITGKSLTVYGNFLGDYTFQSAVKLLESGILDLEKLITHKLPLKDFEIGLKAMEKGEALEVVLYP